MNPTTQAFTRALRRAYSRLNFDQFCEIIGEPPYFGQATNHYAAEKWEQFNKLALATDRLGTLLDRIIMAVEGENDGTTIGTARIG